MTPNLNPAFMRRAIELAIANVDTGKGGPFAALIVKDGMVIAEAANSVTATNDSTAHGEVNAIRAACVTLGTFSLEGCDIYTSCEPCPMCLAAIHWARMRSIYYGSDSEDAARAGFDDLALYGQLRLPSDRRNIPAMQLLPLEASACFQAWHASSKKIDY